MTKLSAPTEHDRWSLAEAVDLPIALEEERFAADRNATIAAARAEVGKVKSSVPGEGDDREALRLWLRHWQSRAPGHTPGEWLADVLRNAARIALFAGIALGLVAASDRLFFTGPEPLNVFFLVGVFVLGPLLLSSILLLTLGIRRPGQGNLLQQFFLFLARKITSRSKWSVFGKVRDGDHLDPAEVLRSDASWKAISKSLGKNSQLLQAPVLAVSQKLALGFGVGLLIMLQLRVSFWELAFGWQTTLTAPEDVWHLVTRAIAAPWSWFWPEATPSLEQIHATRFSRLPGAAPIDPVASRSWWPFLFATILFWSVAIRLVVLMGLKLLQARRLRAFDPMTADAQLLVRRLRPHWTIADPESATPELAPSHARVSAPAPRGGHWIALVADESDATMPRAQDLPELFGVTVERALPFQFDDSMGEKTTSAVKQLGESAAPALIVVPVSRDPIDEVGDTLRGIAAAAPDRATLVLAGPQDRLAVWKRKLDSWSTGLAVEFLPKI